MSCFLVQVVKSLRLPVLKSARRRSPSFALALDADEDRGDDVSTFYVVRNLATPHLDGKLTSGEATLPKRTPSVMSPEMERAVWTL